MLNYNKYQEHYPSPKYQSLKEAGLDVRNAGQGYITVCAKEKSEILVSFSNDAGKWFAGRIVGGVRKTLSDFNYAMYIHHPLALINVAIANGHLE